MSQHQSTEDISAEHADEYIYVSKQHYDRKLQIESDRSNLMGQLARPGPVGALMIYIFDVVIEFFARLIVYVFTFVSTGFDYVVAYTFGTFNGIFPNANKYGTLFSYRFFRYIINLLLPPIGVFLAKGLYGWFNVFICFIFTYIHYGLGILYCFIVTSNNRYADLYEKYEYDTIAETNENYKNRHLDGNIWALASILVIFVALIVIFMLAIKYM